MSNKIFDSLKILNLTGDKISFDEVKNAFKKAAVKYHPDKNPSGAEMMKLVNNAMDVLKEQTFPITNSPSATTSDFGSIINQKLNEIIDLDGLIIEVMGSWVWITGETKKHKDKLSKAKFYYAKKKKAWYFHPPQETKNFYRGRKSLEDIRGTYGSSIVSKSSSIRAISA